MPVDFAKTRKEAENAGLLGSGDYFKLKEGPNKVRLMSECLAHPGTYQGKPNFKWLCYVLDRRDQKVKPYFMQHTVYKQIEALQLDEEYSFVDVPMPYDININAKGAGTKEAEYTVVPARKSTSLTHDELDAMAKEQPLAELQKKLKEKAAEPAQAPKGKEPLYDDDGEPIPF